MSKKVRFRVQLLFVFVERRPSSSDTILDLGRLLLLECNYLTWIFGTFCFCLLIFRLWCCLSQFLFYCSSFGCWESSFFLDVSWVPPFLCYVWSRTTFFETAPLLKQTRTRRQQASNSWGSRDRYLQSKCPFLVSFAIVGSHLSRPPVEQCWRASSIAYHPAWSPFWSRTCHSLCLSLQ